MEPIRVAVVLFVALAAFFITVWVIIPWPKTSLDPDESQDFRLPRNVAPKRYMIDFDFSMEALEYNGTVVIECQALDTTSQITLHENVTMIQWVKTIL
ncbi:hypothetical protein L596_029969 [Steinernema carpocapsae]|uniref:Uncharacterized protein n=1 Tax=Steinernema carpocapsae TaxID=34508 RepID=A0A4U5LRC5_STECR|nr:hypothetical protein L596_029969 [Steinernema carpocapsae]